VLIMAVAFGCTSTVSGGSGSGGTGGSGTGGAGGSGAGGTDAGPPHNDLFACGVALSCERISTHLYPEPPWALECAAKLLLSGAPGALSTLLTPGPYIDEVEDLVLLLGDGTALIQTRERHCGAPGEDPCGVTPQWEPVSAHQLCKVEVPPGLAQACDPGCMTSCNCSWNPQWSECAPVEDWTCQAVMTALGG
jgi:hypothetical protein